MQVDVLLIDDEKHILTALTRVMRQADVTVSSVSSGEEALVWLNENSATLILSDYKMPGMTGTELLAKVEASWPDTVRIILSGHSDFETVLQAVHTGVVHKFLAKPWSNQELIEHIRTSLASKQPKLISDQEQKPEAEEMPPPQSADSDVQLQVVLDTLMDGIVTITQQGVILSVNAAVTRIFGYSPNDLIGKNVSHLMPEPYRSQHDHYLSQYQSPGAKGILGHQRRLVGLRKNGEVFPIELSVNSMQIAGDTQFLGVIRDISRRISAERQNQLLLDALEIAQDGVALFGVGDRLVHCNQQFRNLYLSTGVEIEVGDTYHCFFRRCLEHGLFPEAGTNPEAWLEKQLELHTQLPVTQEYELQPGQWIEIHETQAENGSVIVSHLDISKQKQTQASLEQAVSDAELANSARGRFLAMMSHEIRTPLNGVLGLLQLLQETPLSSEQKQFVTSALSSGRGLLTIISDILDFSKIDADKMQLSPAPCDLKALLAELEQLFKLRVEEKSIQLNIELAASVPTSVYLDGQRLRQVLINLIGNAIKFTEQGEVSLRLSTQSETLCFSVADTGIGIPEVDQPKIFSEFTTIDQTNDRRLYEGTGLGLSICHKLVNLMGGEIEFSSQLGVGSCFSFQLPLQIAHPDETTKRQSFSQLKGRLLVVDDSTTNRLVARTMLQGFGLHVSCAADGYEALKLYQSNNFDLILMDILMPGLNGVETYQRLSQLPEWRNTPVIAFTAYAQNEDKQRFDHIGMQGYLEKPLEKTVLFQTIAPYLAEVGHQQCPAFTESCSDNVSALHALMDTRRIDQLARDTSEEVLPELAAVFITDAHTRLAQIQAGSLQLSDTERHLHTLGSSAALYGLQPMSEQARLLEVQCRSGDRVDESLDSFSALVDASLQALQAHIESRSG
ncbi:response regulator [uncultured Neptuniibacter sp.]|uniref:response regulator n=1 Tax=uncultured Neptuniibacter sp. TaxID=502143 RepID=UPI00260A4E57|nr:response regulator [uncultured Neptuniibacter sp.]